MGAVLRGPEPQEDVDEGVWGEELLDTATFFVGVAGGDKLRQRQLKVGGTMNDDEPE